MRKQLPLLAYGGVVLLAVVLLTLRGEETRNTARDAQDKVQRIEKRVTVPCDTDRSCRKLLDRLLKSSSRRQKRNLARTLQRKLRVEKPSNPSSPNPSNPSQGSGGTVQRPSTPQPRSPGQPSPAPRPTAPSPAPSPTPRPTPTPQRPGSVVDDLTDTVCNITGPLPAVCP